MEGIVEELRSGARNPWEHAREVWIQIRDELYPPGTGTSRAGFMRLPMGYLEKYVSERRFYGRDLAERRLRAFTLDILRTPYLAQLFVADALAIGDPETAGDYLNSPEAEEYKRSGLMILFLHQEPPILGESDVRPKTYVTAVTARISRDMQETKERRINLGSVARFVRYNNDNGAEWVMTHESMFYPTRVFLPSVLGRAIGESRLMSVPRSERL